MFMWKAVCFGVFRSQLQAALENTEKYSFQALEQHVPKAKREMTRLLSTFCGFPPIRKEQMLV
jgi:hypothetical protein